MKIDAFMDRGRRSGLLSAALAAGMAPFGLPTHAAGGGLRPDAPAPAAAGDVAAPHGRADGRRTLKRIPENLVRGAGGVFTRDSLLSLGVGGAATGIGVLLDDEVRDAIADEEDELADFADDNLGPTGLGVVALGLFVGGRFSDDARFRAASYDLAMAAVTTVGYTAALKAAVGRERPDGSGDDSFPSAHTSNAFALASVADAHYGAKVGVPSYLLASLIGASRLRSNAHWLSDVLGGAALGHIVGRAVVRQNSKGLGGSETSGPSTSVHLVLAPGFQGVQVAMRF
jgi:hypothetical protein